MNQTAEAVQHKTCRLTIVDQGMSDRVIKIYPAEHETEKVWLTNTPGIERWQEIQRVINLHAERGKPVPKAVSYHASTEDLRTVNITEADIPTVKLEGYVLPAPKGHEALPANYKPSVGPQALQQRVEALEASVNSIAKGVEMLLAGQKPIPEAPPAPPAPQAPPAPTSEAVDCPKCAREFKNMRALDTHSRSCKGDK